MRRRSAWVWVWVVVWMALLATGVLAAPLGQQLLVQITSPQMGQEVRGVVSIMGSASVPSFQFYKVEFGFGPNPTSWSVIGDLHREPVINGQLELWDTRGLPDGVYTLKLQGVKQDGNWEEFMVRQVVIANTQPTATPQPSATPTLTEERPTVAPSPVVSVTPQVTPTSPVIAPTQALSMATPTPTLSRPTPRSALPIDLPIDPESWRESLLFGAAAMAIILVLLGIVFGLRRLL